MNNKKIVKFEFRAFIVFIIVIFFIVLTGIIIRKDQVYENTNEKYLEENINFKFLKEENNSENMLYSPLSIKYALSMLSLGASGNTKEQIDKVIGNGNLTKYNNIENVLSLVNSIYIRDTFKDSVKHDYIDSISSKYDASVNYDFFVNSNNINNWISKKTFGIIDKMLSDDEISQAEILLLNALAINMKWAESFDNANTYGDKFYLSDGKTIDATFMHLDTSSDNISYYKSDDVVALSMDLQKYEDNQFQFLAIMPAKNLNNYIDKFDENDLNNIINNLSSAKSEKSGISISIPKFSYDYSLKLKKDLINMGITDAFSETNADFSNMSSEKLFVSDALHKARIDFTEDGVKAAAVTVIIMKSNSMYYDEEHISININKPFIYIIRDKVTNEIWFVGTLYEPNLWSDDKDLYEKNY